MKYWGWKKKRLWLSGEGWKAALCLTKRNRSRKSLARTHGFQRTHENHRRRAKGRKILCTKTNPNSGKTCLIVSFSYSVYQKALLMESFLSKATNTFWSILSCEASPVAAMATETAGCGGQSLE
ncbi:Ribosomal protein L34, partial [Prunus dulcis]